MRDSLRRISLVATTALVLGSALATVPLSAKADDVPEEEITTTEVSPIETDIPHGYTDSEQVSAAEGEEQQVEALTQSSPESENAYIVRTDLNSDIAVVGVTWDIDSNAPDSVSLRTLEDNVWSQWQPLELAEVPDDVAVEQLTKSGTDPITLTNVKSIEVVAKNSQGESIDGINVTVIDPRGEEPVTNALEDIEVSQQSSDGESSDKNEDENVQDEGISPDADDKNTDETAEPDIEPDENETVFPEEPDNSGNNGEIESQSPEDEAFLVDPAVFGAGPQHAAVLSASLNPAKTQYNTGENGLVITTRKGWGANEANMTNPGSAIKVKGMVIHHTAGSNNYTKEQVAGQIRGIYNYHAVTLDWGDIGYNLLVDKYGGVWEGRAGGITRATKGMHAYGANSETLGISVLGDYSYSAPPAVAIDSLSKAVAWKLRLHGITNIRGNISIPGNNLAGRTVPIISGHRDVGGTACPGQAFYDRLPEVRNKIESYIKAATKPTPTPNPTPQPSTFDPGNVITDAVFYNGAAMSEAQIKDFIQKQGANCKPGSGTTCLKDTKFATTNLTTDRGACKPLTLTGNQAPWTIISKTASACGLNPQVILATLQKESSGVTQPKTQAQWAKAMGSGCPTGQSCDASQAGFAKQVYYGADKLASYRINPTWETYMVAFRQGKSITIPHNPDAKCGSVDVKLKNDATASLYMYTPYIGASTVSGCTTVGAKSFSDIMKRWFPGESSNPPSPSKMGERKRIGTGWSKNVVYPGDLDGNGSPDMMLVGSDGNMWLYPGMPGEKFNSRKFIGSNWNTMDWIGAGIDLNGDGKADLVARNKDTGELFLYPGNGRGSFQARQRIGTYWQNFSQIALTQTATGPAIYAIRGDYLYYYEGNKRGGFKGYRSLGSGWSVMNALVPVGDWTGDGIPDTLVRDKNGLLFLYEGTKAGVPGKREITGNSWNSMVAVGVSDPLGTKSPLWPVDRQGNLWSYPVK